MNDLTTKTHQTQRCHEHNHPEIRIQVEVVIPDEDCEWFLNTLENMVANGSKFEDNQTLQLGWGLVKFVATQGDAGVEILEIHEPDVQQIPLNFVAGVTVTLRYIRAQKDVLDSLAVEAELDFPNLISAIVVHKNYQDITSINLLRESKQEQLSGWWLFDMTEPEKTHENEDFKPISIYELAINRPDLVQYLALPVGAVVSLRKDEPIRVFREDEELSIREESYLAALNSMDTTTH